MPEIDSRTAGGGRDTSTGIVKAAIEKRVPDANLPSTTVSSYLTNGSIKVTVKEITSLISANSKAGNTLTNDISGAVVSDFFVAGAGSSFNPSLRLKSAIDGVTDGYYPLDKTWDLAIAPTDALTSAAGAIDLTWTIDAVADLTGMDCDAILYWTAYYKAFSYTGYIEDTPNTNTTFTQRRIQNGLDTALDRVYNGAGNTGEQYL